VHTLPAHGFVSSTVVVVHVVPGQPGDLVTVVFLPSALVVEDCVVPAGVSPVVVQVLIPVAAGVLHVSVSPLVLVVVVVSLPFESVFVVVVVFVSGSVVEQDVLPFLAVHVLVV
jgi:hypothetical protein